MKKINNKGFMLVEVLVVSVFVSSVLVVLFSQFKKINNSYDVSFKYNTVDNLYLLENVKNRIVTNVYEHQYDNYVTQLNNNDNPKTYLNIYNVENTCTLNAYDCELLKKANVKSIYFTNSSAKEDMLKDTNISLEFRGYIKYMNFNVEDATYDYFLIGEFIDGTFASINIKP